MRIFTFVFAILIFTSTAQAETDRAEITGSGNDTELRYIRPSGTCYNIDGGNLGQRIVNAAVAEWARFDFPVWDISRGGVYLFPRAFDENDQLTYQVVDPASTNNPFLEEPSLVPRLLRQGTKEDDQAISDRIGEYWAVVSGRNYARDIQNAIWAAYGSSGFAVPWSAAFVSWVMCEAGLELDNFKRRSAHSDYIVDIIRNGGNPERAFHAFDASDVSDLAPGDIICADRQHASQPYIDGIDDPRIQDRHTHCDVVVKVDYGRVFAIGGNVIDGVTMTMTPLNDDGTLRASVKRHPNSPTDIRHWFAVLRLKNNPSLGETPGTAFERAMEADVVQEKIEFLSGAG